MWDAKLILKSIIIIESEQEAEGFTILEVSDLINQFAKIAKEQLLNTRRLN